MNKTRASEIIDSFKGKRVLVVGDVMLDEYIWGQVNRISPEAPVIVVDAERYSQVPGGAANVVNNLCALGANGAIAGLIGDDDAGRALTETLQAEGAETHGLLVLDDRPTTRKTRIIAHSQQVVRVDHERRGVSNASVVIRLVELIDSLANDTDAVLLSDYQKGVLTPAVIEGAIASAKRRGIPITGNLKPIALYNRTSLTVLTLNLIEASTAVGGRPLTTDKELERAASEILVRTGCENVLITRGSQGLSLFPAHGAPSHISARPVEVYDVAGAGDTVISTLTLALVAGASNVEAVTLANHAAAEAVKKLGVSTVSPEEVLSSFDEW